MEIHRPGSCKVREVESAATAGFARAQLLQGPLAGAGGWRERATAAPIRMRRSARAQGFDPPASLLCDGCLGGGFTGALAG